MPGYLGKRRFVPGNETNTAPMPLNAIVLLDRSQDARTVNLTPVPPIEALGYSTRQRIRFNPADTTGTELHKTFAALSSIVQAAPCFRLSYPPDYGALSNVVGQLQEILQS
jgi:hypothetical protein